MIVNRVANHRAIVVESTARLQISSRYYNCWQAVDIWCLTITTWYIVLIEQRLANQYIPRLKRFAVTVKELGWTSGQGNVLGNFTTRTVGKLQSNPPVISLGSERRNGDKVIQTWILRINLTSHDHLTSIAFINNSIKLITVDTGVTEQLLWITTMLHVS